MPTPVADRPLSERYGPDALEVFDAGERKRFLDADGRPRDAHQLPWEILYRLEPELYDRLIAGERLHPAILGWLPSRCRRGLEIGAGTGRLTVDLAPRCDRLTAVEPAAPLRRRLRERLEAAGLARVDVVPGFFDALPVPPASCDLVISCSAFSPASMAAPERCLDAMESRCLRGGLVVVVWPNQTAWLRDHGFERIVFDGPMRVEYASVIEALEVARVFHPHAVGEIARRDSRFVDYDVLGINPPRDLCWKRRA